MKEIVQLFVIDSPMHERLDGVYEDKGTLTFRSQNSGEVVVARHNAYYCEATYLLDKKNSEKFVKSLNTTCFELP